MVTDGDEGRSKLRKAPWSCLTSFDTRISEWVNLARVIPCCRVSLLARREPAEVKHLSKRRKRKKVVYTTIPLVAASEEGTA